MLRAGANSLRPEPAQSEKHGPTLSTPRQEPEPSGAAVKEPETMQPREFTPFSRLPPEMRAYIWDLALPGPRVLSLGTGFGSRRNNAHMLYFPQGSTAPNPALLSTCREARAAAQRRYKLVFGTPNVYADLSGGDILYFGPEFESAEFSPSTGNFWQWYGISAEQREWLTEASPSPRHISGADYKLNTYTPSVLADLQAVRHIALSYTIWLQYWDPLDVFPEPAADGDEEVTRGGAALRRDLASFPHLSHVTLSVDPSNGGNWGIPGFPVFEKPPPGTNDEMADIGGLAPAFPLPGGASSRRDFGERGEEFYRQRYRYRSVTANHARNVITSFRYREVDAEEKCPEIEMAWVLRDCRGAKTS
ncbi:hypothetical protein BP5796_11517 [Coleophoma crateriformis]|uniref:2EXR domain-containing protein n=1 Tax=Coleophoma crateriformis TaxID=565419 RepID=A0A3D8QIK4_9HELO|nr:hypothetical protein BP5796_11517 [Coleophoma crateriformis]